MTLAPNLLPAAPIWIWLYRRSDTQRNSCNEEGWDHSWSADVQNFHDSAWNEHLIALQSGSLHFNLAHSCSLYFWTFVTTAAFQRTPYISLYSLYCLSYESSFSFCEPPNSKIRDIPGSCRSSSSSWRVSASARWWLRILALRIFGNWKRIFQNDSRLSTDPSSDHSMPSVLNGT